MYRLLKKKQVNPLLYRPWHGTLAKNQDENLQIVLQHFKGVFSVPLDVHLDKERCRELIRKARETVVPHHTALQLDFAIQPSEMEQAIKSLKNHKIPGLDGLPVAEFFKKFQHLLIQPLLQVWSKYLHYGDLP